LRLVRLKRSGSGELESTVLASVDRGDEPVDEILGAGRCDLNTAEALAVRVTDARVVVRRSTARAEAEALVAKVGGVLRPADRPGMPLSR